MTTALQEFWPEGGPIWLLSPGCALGEIEIESNSRWEIRGVVSDPFQEAQESTIVYENIWRVADDLIRLLAGRLNIIHEANHSEGYWRTQIGYWAICFVSVVFDRYIRLLRARSEIDDIKVIGCKNNILPLDSDDFVYEARDDLYNCQIYTFLCNKLGIPIVEYRSVDGRSFPEKTQYFSTSKIKRLLRPAFFSFFSKLSPALGRRADILLVNSYLPRWFEIALSFLTCGRVFPLYFDAIQHGRNSAPAPVDAAARSILCEVPQAFDGLEAIVVEMVGWCIPTSLVEGYSDICSRAERIYGGYQPKAIYSANSWYGDEVFKHWAAQCKEQGTILIGGEHGGAPFLEKFWLYEALEIEIADVYLTWGWEDPRVPKAVATPANKLVDLVDRRVKGHANVVLYVSTGEARHNVGRLENFARYLGRQKRFFESIDPVLIPNFLVRTHYQDFGWNIRGRLLRVAPDLKFDRWNVDFAKRILGVRLCVVDYIGTTFAEALSSNVPTIVYSDDAAYPVGERWNSHFLALREAGILHDTPESAAAWVAKVYENPASWWLSEDCQKAVGGFCGLYARKSRTPIRDWKRILESLLCPTTVLPSSQGSTPT